MRRTAPAEKQLLCPILRIREHGTAGLRSSLTKDQRGTSTATVARGAFAPGKTVLRGTRMGRRTLRCGLALGLVVLFLLQPRIFADTAPAASLPAEATGEGGDETANASSEATKDASPESLPEEEKREGRQKVVAAAFLLMGILGLGLFLLALVLWWGFRVRRLVRRPLPKAGPGDELWYLKHTTAGESPRPPGTTSRGNAPQSDDDLGSESKVP